MRNPITRNLEYLLVALIGVVGAAAIAVAAARDDGEPPRTPSTTAAPPVERPRNDAPSCRDAGITPASTREGTCRTASSTLTIVNQDSSLRLPGLTVRVTEATTTPASTAQGRARDRMRVTVRLRLENTGSVAFVPAAGERDVYLFAGNRRISSDSNARSAAGALSLAEPLEPGQQRSGELRFELAGFPTRVIERVGRAALGVRVAEDRVGVVRLRFPGAGG